MKYLLDTHILIWSIVRMDRVESIRSILEDPDNQIYFSAASIWEISIKYSLGKLTIPPDEVIRFAIEQGFTELAISAGHTAGIQNLRYPEDIPKHRDPFDNILISQARDIGAFLITADDKIGNYLEPCIMKI